MVEILPCPVLMTQAFMHQIVKVTADAGTPQALRLSFQIEGLADQARLPEQARVAPGGVFLIRGSKPASMLREKALSPAIS